MSDLECKVFVLAGIVMRRLLSGEQTAGQFCLFENKSDGNTKTPIHVHARDDETIYIIEGELTAVVDGRPVTLASPRDAVRANIGISLPGTGEVPVAPVYVDGQKTVTLKGDEIAEEFEQMPRGVPVATFAIGEAGAANAALTAIAILAATDESLAAQLQDFRAKQTQAALAMTLPT